MSTRSARSVVLTVLIVLAAGVGWLLVRGLQPGRTRAPAPEVAEPGVAPSPAPLDVEEAELVAPEARVAVEPPALEEEPPAALTDGIVAPPTPPLPDFEGRYAGVPRDELEVRLELLRKKLHDIAWTVHEEQLERGDFKTLSFPPGQTAMYTSPPAPVASMTSTEMLPDGGQLMKVSEFDSSTHPRTAALWAEADWLSRRLSENNTAKK